MAAKVTIEAYGEEGIVFIPKDLLDRLGWREGTELDMKIDGTRIKISELRGSSKKRFTSSD